MNNNQAHVTHVTANESSKADGGMRLTLPLKRRTMMEGGGEGVVFVAQWAARCVELFNLRAATSRRDDFLAR